MRNPMVPCNPLVLIRYLIYPSVAHNRQGGEIRGGARKAPLPNRRAHLHVQTEVGWSMTPGKKASSVRDGGKL